MGKSLESDYIPYAFSFDILHFHLFITQIFLLWPNLFHSGSRQSVIPVWIYFFSTRVMNSASLLQNFTLRLFISFLFALLNRLWWYGCAWDYSLFLWTSFCWAMELLTLFFWKNMIPELWPNLLKSCDEKFRTSSYYSLVIIQRLTDWDSSKAGMIAAKTQ